VFKDRFVKIRQGVGENPFLWQFVPSKNSTADVIDESVMPLEKTVLF